MDIIHITQAYCLYWNTGMKLKWWCLGWPGYWHQWWQCPPLCACVTTSHHVQIVTLDDTILAAYWLLKIDTILWLAATTLLLSSVQYVSRMRWLDWTFVPRPSHQILANYPAARHGPLALILNMPTVKQMWPSQILFLFKQVWKFPWLRIIPDH